VNIKDWFLDKFKKENKETLKRIEDMTSGELMQHIQECNYYIEKLENKDGYAFTGLNIGFYYNKSNSNIPDNETLEEINPYLEEILKEIAIEYYRKTLKQATERLKELL